MTFSHPGVFQTAWPASSGRCGGSPLPKRHGRRHTRQLNWSINCGESVSTIPWFSARTKISTSFESASIVARVKEGAAINQTTFMMKYGDDAGTKPIGAVAERPQCTGGLWASGAVWSGRQPSSPGQPLVVMMMTMMTTWGYALVTKCTSQDNLWLFWQLPTCGSMSRAGQTEVVVKSNLWV